MTDPGTGNAVEAPVEHVLVIPTAVFHELGHFQGFCGDSQRYLDVVLDPIHASYRPRNEMEQDPSFKQLIPYCVFEHDGQLFSYRRGTDQGEARLHAKRSVGVGGHVSTLDLDREGSPYSEGMKREIEEEVNLASGWTERCVGLINDDESDVGKVHLGIVHIFSLDSAQVTPREKSMLDAGFAPPEELLRELDEFETWSQICLKALFQT
ncbi:phosphoesterase [Fuerstiella marisgermanici]|uniref:Putative phosphoesterase (MutT family) n=1 Tax=Fuerstiella marisgermanici TaxID=1891926 RepID=A0A1P8WRN2_9PLAN|nr:phosphoesterase [Fuerstiella marisgermanici]APZ96713.1 putative phosphoesterase (MutT family) [Fuerstiella marisgermanici]